MSDDYCIMAFTKRHFNVKPNTKKSPLLKESSDVDMREGDKVKFPTWKCPPCMYSISSSKCKYDAGGIEMQLIWSLLQNTVLINNSCHWALFNLLLFSDGTLWLMKNNRKCEVDLPFLNIRARWDIQCQNWDPHTLVLIVKFYFFENGHFCQKWPIKNVTSVAQN